MILINAEKVDFVGRVFVVKGFCRGEEEFVGIFSPAQLVSCMMTTDVVFESHYLQPNASAVLLRQRKTKTARRN